MTRTSAARLCARSALALAAAVTLFSFSMNRIALADEAKTGASEGEKTAVDEPAAEEAKQVNVAGVNWYADYYAAYRAAKHGRRMLLVNILPAGASPQQQSAEAAIGASGAMQIKLQQVVCVRLPVDATIDVNGAPRRLLSFSAFSELQNGPGFVLIDLTHEGTPYFGLTVNVLPYSSGKYYQWRSDYLAVILDLPPGTLTQRTMVWAVRVHPERPQSTNCDCNSGLEAGATEHSIYQANVEVQGHQGFETRFASLSAAAGTMGVSEVVAESWPSENLIDSCLDCVDSWRHSPGHWQGVSRPHRAFGYDIRRGRNGIWYGTGIFAD